METACVKVRLKANSLDRVHDWANELRARSEEVLVTLRDEGVVLESVFLDSDELGDFLVYVIRARSLEAAHATARRSTHPIDSYHEQFKLDTWDSSAPLKLLFDFENFG